MRKSQAVYHNTQVMISTKEVYSPAQVVRGLVGTQLPLQQSDRILTLQDWIKVYEHDSKPEKTY